MKRILLLGGAAHQVTAIVKAKEMGCTTILCDCYEDAPGQKVADAFYAVSTTDREEILQIARKEHVDGVLAYASDPAALTAAYVQKMMHLPCGIPYDSVRILSNKYLFRSFQSDYHFPRPRFVDLSYQERIGDLKFPLILKPCDCSGSRGVHLIHSLYELTAAWEDAHRCSHIGSVIAEEFLHEGTHIIGGDILIIDGHVVKLGLFECVRDEACPLIPVGKNWPCKISELDRDMILNNLQRLSNLLHIQNAVLNVELCIDGKHRPIILDIGPRAGGNRIPEILSEITGFDWIECMIRMAMGENMVGDSSICINQQEMPVYRSLYVLHTMTEGILQRIQYSEELEQYITDVFEDRRQGDMIYGFRNASQKLGIIFLNFPDAWTQQDIMSRIDTLITIEVREADVV